MAIDVKIDNQEKKTPSHIERLLEIWNLKHPNLVKLFNFVYMINLKWGDILANDNIAEIKWGQDLNSSLLNHKLEKELLGMTEEFPFMNRFLILSPMKNYAFTNHDWAMLYPICLETKTKLIYGDNPIIALGKFLHIAKNGYKTRVKEESSFVLEGMKKNPCIAKALSCLFDGFSIEFAIHFIHPTWQSLRDIVDSVDYDYVLSKTSQYYEKHMNELNSKILRVIQG